MDRIRGGLIELDEYEDEDDEGSVDGFMQDYEAMFEFSDSFDELFHILPVSEEEEEFYVQLQKEIKASGKDCKNDKKMDIQPSKAQGKARRLLVSSGTIYCFHPCDHVSTATNLISFVLGCTHQDLSRISYSFASCLL